MYHFFLKVCFYTSICLFCFGACMPKEKPKTDDELKQLANELAHKYIITDGHVDLPYRLITKGFRFEKEFLGIPISSPVGDFDYERAKKGGLDAPFMSIYIPSYMQKTSGKSKAYADTLINMIEGIAKTHPDKFAMAGTPTEVEENFKKGIISLPMGMENGAPIEEDLRNVAYFFNRGIRYITLTHALDNKICDSSYDTTHTWNGLSPFGVEVVREMNKVGIMVDVSHVSDSTFYQVMRLSKVPCIASHSSCRSFTPEFVRNMSDDMIKLLAKNGGVIQINFGSDFLDAEINKQNKKLDVRLDSLLKVNHLKGTDSTAKLLVEQFAKDNPSLFTTVEKVADHIDHVVKIAGIDYVGLGSDYDGVGDTLPMGLKDVTGYPNLIYVLLKRGYSEEDIAKICYKNVFRVWSKTLKMRNLR
jgi:membrane dipeptidase